MTPETDDGPVGFTELGLRPELLRVLSELGYEEPTPIQREAIPPLLNGRDLLGQAATGTGKTAAFALPLLQRLTRAERGLPAGARPQRSQGNACEAHRARSCDPAVDWPEGGGAIAVLGHRPDLG